MTENSNPDDSNEQYEYGADPPQETRRSVLKQLGLAASVGLISGTAATGYLTQPTTALQSDEDAYTTEDVEIESFDGTTLTATVYEPTADGEFPAILMTHGWGGQRQDRDPRATAYATAGYVVLTYDSRGFGESEGQVTSTGPNEQQDASALISWLADHDSVITDGADNPRIGMDGFSYGGGIQFRTAAHDDRLDAIVPRVTWNNLAQALEPNEVLKLGWVSALAAGAQDDNLDPQLEDITNRALDNGRYADDDREFYRQRSPITYPDVETPALIIQEWTDRLFPANDAVANYQLLQDAGTESVLLIADGPTHFFGEPPAGSETAIEYADQTALTWLDSHLKEDGEHDLAPVHYYREADDQVVQAEEFPPEPERTVSWSLPAPVTLDGEQGNVETFDVTLDERTEIVGLPTLEADVSPVGPDFNHLMVAVQRVSGGTVTTLQEQVTPLLVEEEGPIELELAGVQGEFEAGETLRIALCAQDDPLTDVEIADALGGSLFVDSADSGGVELLDSAAIELTVPASEPLPDPDVGAVPTPDVDPLTGGTVTGNPQTSAVHDIEQYGYVETEYAISGEARVVAEPVSLFGEDPDPPEEPAEYTTRMLVYRPDDPADFNGEVLVDWMNVTNQRDAPVTWINAHDYLMREGYAVALLSTQQVGVENSELGQDLVNWDPERYGDLNHPGDAYAFDIFSQAIQSLRGEPATDPLDGLDPDYVLATGMSQSAFFLQPYIAEVQPDHELVDGFLPAALNVFEPAVTQSATPVLWLNTEDEAPSQAADTDTFRLWEVAGASHVNFWLTAWFDVMDARDFDIEPDWFPTDAPEWDRGFAGQYGQLEDAVYGICGTNYFPVRYAYKAALARLSEWVREGQAPSTPPRIEHDDGDVQMDEFDNAQGGLRLPPIEAPVASYFARDEVCGGEDGLSDLLGATVRFENDELESLYGTANGYRAQFRAATQNAVAEGYLLETDATDLMARAETIQGLPERGVDHYADPDTGDVETDALREAIDDWRDETIGTDLLRAVIDGWRASV